MIKITGTIDYVGDGFLVLEREGIGYKIIFPSNALLGASGTMSVYTHEVIRDDSHDFFGFFSMDALELFWKLVAVSGVGAKSAQKIVFTSSVEEVRSRIMNGDLGFLIAVPGIGKKTAQKIILELKGVLMEETGITADSESFDALMSLGYSRKQAADALAGVEATETEDRIKLALRSLAKS